MAADAALPILVAFSPGAALLRPTGVTAAWGLAEVGGAGLPLFRLLLRLWRPCPSPFASQRRPAL